MYLGLLAAVYGIVLVAELPDKTMFASLLLSTRFGARWVFVGAAAAFVVHVVIAVTAGSLLGLLPHRVLEIVVAALFLIGAAFLFRESRHQDQAGDDAGKDDTDGIGAPTATAFAAVGSSFAVIFVGEWGDITQIATADLAAKYHHPVVVGIGAVLGLWTAALLAITAGRTLLKVISVRLLHQIGAAIFLALAVVSAVEAIRA